MKQNVRNTKTRLKAEKLPGKRSRAIPGADAGITH